MKLCDIKICGITREEDVEKIVQFEEIKYVGCINFNDSSRNVSLEKASNIFKEAKKARPDIKCVLVLVNPSMEYLQKAMKITRADIVQLSGTEGESFVNSLDLYVVWKTVHIGDYKDLSRMNNFLYVNKFVLDTKVDSLYGGTGKEFNIDIFNQAKNYARNLVLAGGINPENIMNILFLGNPEIIDICSGVEVIPGVKDMKKVEMIVEMVKGIQVSKK